MFMKPLDNHWFKSSKNQMMNDKEKLKVRRHFSYNLLSAAVGMMSSSGGDGIWEEMDVSRKSDNLLII